VEKVEKASRVGITVFAWFCSFDVVELIAGHAVREIEHDIMFLTA